MPDITGTSGDDSLTATSPLSVIRGLEGNDTLIGSAGNDILAGGRGFDQISGGDGDDILIPGEGDGTFNPNGSYSFLSYQTTHSFNNGNDSLDGGAGNDRAIVYYTGFTGNMSFHVTGALTLNNAAFGYIVNVERFGFWGGSGNDDIELGSGNDTLDGGAGNDTLLGGAGDDSIRSGRGADEIDGGLGIDTAVVMNEDVSYQNLVFNVTGQITANGVVYGSISNIENLHFHASSGNDSIVSGAGNDWLTGGPGDDYLVGGDGDDRLSGGDSQYYIHTNQSSGDDTLDGGDGIDTMDYGDEHWPVVVSLALQGQLQSASAAGQDLLLNFENLNGSGYDDILSGDENSNTIFGDWGDDTISGAGGDDVLYGSFGDDILDGGTGADTLEGVIGNDTYYVDQASDIVTELENFGNDSVLSSSHAYTLRYHVENLIFIGTGNFNGAGNEQANSITGGAGNDLLNGGGGADTLTGAAGNDTYYVDNAGDVIVEAASAGTDSVVSSITWTLGANVERLTLSGATGIGGTGNALNNLLLGNAAANFLNGGAGADDLRGGLGNDVYIVDNAGDVIVEAANGGTDVVRSTVTHILAANVENLLLTGSASVTGLGNALNNNLTGNGGANVLMGGGGADVLSGAAGNDTLYGGGGADRIYGGAGADAFVLNTAIGAAHIDKFQDFSVADDTIWLENAIFTKFAATGALNAGFFRVGAAAADANDHIIYNSATGAVFYDSNGNAAGSAVQIATLSAGLALTSADFLVS